MFVTNYFFFFILFVLNSNRNKIKNSMYCNNVSDNEKLNLAENHVKEYNL